MAQLSWKIKMISLENLHSCEINAKELLSLGVISILLGKPVKK
jgi:hypothetical protein